MEMVSSYLFPALRFLSPLTGPCGLLLLKVLESFLWILALAGPLAVDSSA